MDAARLRYLTMAEAQRLTDACGPDFRLFVEAALQTGARYGQLAVLRVVDTNVDAGTVRLSTRKGDEAASACIMRLDGGRSALL